MRLLWVGDAVVSSGFARCSHKVCDYLHSQGHEIHILGINYYGDPHSYPYSIYPCNNPLDSGRDAFGVTRLPSLIFKLKPDIVIILQDPWNIHAYLSEIDKWVGQLVSAGIPTSQFLPLPPIVGWLAVDGKNQNGRDINGLSHVITWTQFGADELIKGGYAGDYSIVPLGVDTSLYYKRDKLECRRMMSVMDTNPLLHEAFIVGYVGRNQPRKRLDLLIEYFAEWVHKYNISDGYLYLHVGPTGDTGVDIESLIKYYNVRGLVLVNQPDIGTGDPESLMPYIYSLMDVFVTTTQGEGFGLPILEAMACRVPVIAPDWSGLGSEGGWTAYQGQPALSLVSCTSTALTMLQGRNACTIGGIPDKALMIEALNSQYRASRGQLYWTRRGEPAYKVDIALDLARSLTWESAGAQIQIILQKQVSHHNILEMAKAALCQQ